MSENPACPSFFQAACGEAARGGSDGYYHAGKNLAGAIGGLGPHDMEAEEWTVVVSILDQLLEAMAPDPEDASRVDKAVIGWFALHLPRCLDLVPEARRRAFVQGVRDYTTENEEYLDGCPPSGHVCEVRNGAARS